jgi:serine/threonine-protein kinase
MTALNGKYILDKRLGGGGMAEVFLARTVGAEGFSRRVAIKRVLPGYSENPQFAKMFVAEAQLSSRLQHPNVVSVADFDRDAEGRLFLVMELVEGVDLDGLNATGMLSFPLIIHVIGEVLRGLGYAHDLPPAGDGVRGLIHRDVSPHNVLLSWEGAVKVSDFGIAKARASRRTCRRSRPTASSSTAAATCSRSA